jgi:GNAT superfamily N-acetyltransferase
VDKVDDLKIRPATADELPMVAGIFAQGHYFANRFKLQQSGLGALVIAWLADEPVANLYVRLEPAEEPEIRKHLPEVPILNHIEVRADWRRQRIGSALITATERFLIDAGYALAALGVAPDNYDAARLYERLGYRWWGHPNVETQSEVFVNEESAIRSMELCRVLVKQIAPSGRGQCL